MRLNRFFIDAPLAPNTTISLPEATAHHVVNVLRMKVGDTLTLFNGTKTDYPGTISAIKRYHIGVEIHKALPINTHSPVEIHLGQCMVKGDKMDFITQKAVELGACSLTPVIAMRSQLQKAAQIDKKKPHLQSVAQGALAQSGRSDNFTIHQALDFASWCAQSSEQGLSLILNPYHGQKISALSHSNVEKIFVLIGPEGGFNQKEIDQAKDQKLQEIQTGPRILQSPTAALCAISLLQAQFGDF